ncbi:ABC efflux pump, inner membrane subunit [Candidatus Koribacter versatilis Ellin345]|uniref:ABC efflux pump, inner membrane subunit n=1 Tax=Koribacter versatilis (strain Ellin345) TaxID=204669 RepID=Q1IHM3_KORVE|nr:ABC transporter permease [Candidatus Koribacter versatilis]ABF43627.1 ABC efflux pump, inner membrane subunit [Candidatus Koribacter versatilis Ellin345]
MKLIPRARSWFRSVSHDAQLQRDMDDELRFHVESYIEDLVKSGVSRQEATRRARIEFGSADAHKEAMRVSLGLRLWDELRSDVRYAVRMLKKSPSFTAIALLSLTLGIGANTTIFTLAKHLMIDRLNVPHPEQLRLMNWISPKHGAVHSIWGEWDKENGGNTSTSFSYPVYEYLRAHNHQLSDLFGFKNIGRANVTIDQAAEVVQADLVSGNFYSELGIAPQIGRVIDDADDKPGATPVAVISDGYWARRFGRSPAVLGKTITLNLTPVTIVGVNPKGFTGARQVQSSSDIYVPFSLQPQVAPNFRFGSLLTNTREWWMQIMARTKPGVNEEAARAELDIALKDAVRATMNPKKDEALPTLRVGDGSRGLNEAGRNFASPVYVLMALVGFVLLLACANLANLLLARTSARQREMSVRLAMGASRRRVLRQVLTESMMLSLLGGLGGLLLGYFGRLAIPHLVTNAWEEPMSAAPYDWKVFAFNLGLSLLTGILFGIAPAWQATRAEVNTSLKDSAQSTTRRRRGYGGKAVVGFQIALSTVLVLGSGIFLRTLVNLTSVDPGFETKNLVLFEMRLPQARYPVGKDLVLYRDLEQRLAAIPGVDSVGLSSVTLLAHSMSNDDFVPTGQKPEPGKETAADDNAVNDDFFKTMRIPILAGRAFNASDTETSQKVAIVNQALVKQFWPNENPIGKTFETSGSNDKKELFTIVGLCADTHYDDLRKEPPPTFFLSYRQASDISWGMTFEIKTRQSRAAITPMLREALRSVDRDLPLTDVRTQDEQIDGLLQQERLFATITGAFGVLALVLACIGIYGIMSYNVARRTNEIGIRLALGAKTQQVLAMVLREASWLAIVGVVVGLGAGLALVRLIRTMLYGMKPWDPVSIAIAAGLLLGVSLIAGYVPARRASKVEPMVALRHE